MKALLSLAIVCGTLAAEHLAAQDLFDRVDQALTVTAFHDQVRARLSGLADVEGYYFQKPPPGLIDASGNGLFNPRLSLFLDAQLGPRVYLFVQSRFDRGFDPTNGNAEARADEYAIRITPWQDSRFNLQVGKFATVVGTWVSRHLSWDNPFVTAPLPYENRTAISNSDAPESAHEFTAGLVGSRYEYSPMIWGPSYTTGAAVFGRMSRFEYAAELKNAALSSYPESWEATQVGFDQPTVGVHLGFHPNPMWTLGFSASEGAYLSPEARPTLPAGKGLGAYPERLLGQDVSFAWHHWQLWAEVYETRFEVPRVGAADTLAYYFEAKYKLTPQLFAAARWNQQFFAQIRDEEGRRTPWGPETWRTDLALGYRFTAHTQLKLQYSVGHNTAAPREFSHLVTGQFTLRF